MLWRITQQHPSAPPFSGGVLDGWPNWAVRGFAIANAELSAIRRFAEQERRRHG